MSTIRPSTAILLMLSFIALPLATYAAPTKPLQARKLSITNKEFLTYGVFVSGQRYQNANMLSVLSADSSLITVYVGKYTIGSKFPMPKKYTDYQRTFTVSLKDASLTKASADYYQQFILDNKTGETGFSIDIDKSNNMAVFVSKIWDGYDLMKKTTRIKLIPGYPVWDVLSIGFVGSRFLDINDDGIVYGISPSYVKEAVPIMGRKIKKESITTPAGTFACQKIGIGVTDPFLAQLLDTYVKELYLWIEDSPRGLVVKTTTPGESYILESIGTWKE